MGLVTTVRKAMNLTKACEIASYITRQARYNEEAIYKLSKEYSKLQQQLRNMETEIKILENRKEAHQIAYTILQEMFPNQLNDLEVNPCL